MLDLDIPFELNTLATNTLGLLFARIAARYASLKITPATHYVQTVQQMPTRYRPWLSVATVRSLTDPSFEQRFRYDRWPVSRYVKNPVFNATELAAVQQMDEVQLVAALRTKLNLNINNVDFIIRNAGIQYVGGEARPNWRLTAAPNSSFWYDDQVLWLHNPA